MVCERALEVEGEVVRHPDPLYTTEGCYEKAETACRCTLATVHLLLLRPSPQPGVIAPPTSNCRLLKHQERSPAAGNALQPWHAQKPRPQRRLRPSVRRGYTLGWLGVV